MGGRELVVISAPHGKNAVPKNDLAALISDRVMNMIGSKKDLASLQEGIWF
jgi:hypothetical protein